MDEAAYGRAYAAVRDCALAMMENATYVQGELPNVTLPDDLRTRTAEVCESLVGTKHDVIHELFEIDDSNAETEARLASIVGWLEEATAELHDLVLALRSASEADQDVALAYVLVMESATNILDAFNEAAEAVAPLRPGTEEDV